MSSAEVIEGGLQATVQDYPGRRGMLSKGFFPAGPMDHFAHRAANLLVGNPESAATLEITLGNFRIRFDEEATVAVCGAEAPVTIGGEAVALWESHRVAPGAEVSIGIAPVRGFRLYLAVAGGFDVPELFGSRATYTMGALGGFEGRSLQQGDRLPIGERERRRRRAAASGRSAIPAHTRQWEVRAMRGPAGGAGLPHRGGHGRRCSAASGRSTGTRTAPGSASNRTSSSGRRQSGGIAGGHPSNILDNSYPVGAINVNGDLPVILGPDGPTAGGFVVAATVIHADFWKIGQFRPVGDTVRFREVTIDEAIDGRPRARRDSLGESSLEAADGANDQVDAARGRSTGGRTRRPIRTSTRATW